MIRLDGWLTLDNGEKLLAGELACGDTDCQGSYPSAFRYAAGYLADARAYALDPANLPLQPGEFSGSRLEAPLLALEDALPDDWRRRLLILRHGLPRGQQSEPHLLRALAEQGLGALTFLAPGTSPQPHDDSATLLDLETLQAASRRLEQDGEVDDSHRLLLAAGSSPGGARPKALVRDAEGHWIAKFSSRRDEVDVVGLEATCLELARLAGLVTAEFRLEPLAGGRRTLLVKRFDLTPAGGASPYAQPAGPAAGRRVLRSALCRPDCRAAPSWRPAGNRCAAPVPADGVQRTAGKHRRPPEKLLAATRQSRLHPFPLLRPATGHRWPPRTRAAVRPDSPSPRAGAWRNWGASGAYPVRQLSAGKCRMASPVSAKLPPNTPFRSRIAPASPGTLTAG